MKKDEPNPFTHMPRYPEPYWRDHVTIPSFPKLTEDISADAVIVGGGITGITAAYLLANDGLKVVLLEADKLINGTTGHTTAKITVQHDLIYDELIRTIGEEKAKQYFESNNEALSFIRNLVNEHKISCDFSEEDAILYADKEMDADQLKKEYEAYKKLGIPGEYTEKIALDIPVKAAIVLKNQAQFHPVKYLIHLIHHITEKGGRIYESTAAKEVDGKSSVITQDGYSVSADHVLSCSHFPFLDGMGFYFTRMYAERSYVIAVKPEKPYPGGMYLSAGNPKRSIRSVTLNGEKYLLIGGESHKTGQGINTIRHYEALEHYARQAFQFTDYRYRWSAQDLITLDKVPYIGHLTSHHENILAATGYRKWGMTNGTAAAHLLRDIVLKRDNPYKELFTPSRFHPDPSVKAFLKDNADVAKHLVMGKLERPERVPEDLGKDEGGVVKVHGKRCGAYKDSNGKLYIVDTTCTHLGCETEWNSGDRTWDCPCHGSRFSYEGKVVEGPAKDPLKPIDTYE